MKEGQMMKNKQSNDCQVVPFPKIRRGLAIMYPSVKRKPMVHGLMEVDVTEVRQYLRKHKAQTGESLSFTAFIITCLAHAIDENKFLHAYQKGRKRLVIFEDVDVATVIERDMSGQKQPIVYIIRAANKKTLRKIHQEIRAAQAEQAVKAWAGWEDFKGFLFLPMVFFRFFWKVFCWIRRTYPQVQKKYGGTVGISAVGMFSKGGGWGIPINDHTLDLTLGGIAEKPGVVDGHIAIREYLCITLSVNHAIVDGAPAARFATRLKELIESRYGLCESETEDSLRRSR
jgi:pyruvate/2-oxoglutarate dehydrogenase complex dihydrolipoamide acyltransferase (E2) component